MRKNCLLSYWLVPLACVAVFTACQSARGALVPFEIHVVGAHGHPLHEVSAAQHLLNYQSANRFDTTAEFDTINFNLPNHPDGGMFAGDADFPGLSSSNQGNFALDATASVKIPIPGTYTFAVSSDDGFRLQVGDYSRRRSVHRPTNTYVHFVFDQAGDYPLDLTYYQHRKHAELELFAAQGSFAHFDQPGANFQLVGDVANGGLELVRPSASHPNVGQAIPEPASAWLVASLAAIGLFRRRPNRPRIR